MKVRVFIAVLVAIVGCMTLGVGGRADAVGGSNAILDKILRPFVPIGPPPPIPTCCN
jgi:hypothetical protein